MVPVIFTWYGPAVAPEPTMKVPVIAPAGVSVQPTKVSGKLAEIPQDETVAVIVTEAGSASEACTPTVPPIGAASGVKETTGAAVPTMSVAEAESPVLPVTVIVKVPDEAVLTTAKDVDVSTPGMTLLIVHGWSAPIMLLGVLVIVQVAVSAVLKPLPVIVTVPPADTKVGFNVIKGVGDVTVNMAEAESPTVPVAVMV